MADLAATGGLALKIGELVWNSGVACRIASWFGIGFVALPDAMRQLYEATLDSEIAEFARGNSRPAEEVLTWYAYWAHERGLPLYGMRPPSNKLERIPNEAIAMAHFSTGSLDLMESYDPQPRYTGLAVRRRDFRRHWRALTRLIDGKG